MNTQIKLRRSQRILISVVIFVHLMFFLLEAIFWMRPEVYTPLLKLLDNPVESNFELQALTLKNLFINQGFYNLFLVVEGVVGYQFIKRGHMAIGYILLIFLSVSAAGAGVVLASSTKAYILAAFQTLPAVLVLVSLSPDFIKLLKASQGPESR